MKLLEIAKGCTRLHKITMELAKWNNIYSLYRKSERLSMWFSLVPSGKFLNDILIMTSSFQILYHSIIWCCIVWDSKSHKTKNKEKITRSDKQSSLNLHSYCWNLYNPTYQKLYYYQHCHFILIHLGFFWGGMELSKFCVY